MVEQDVDDIEQDDDDDVPESVKRERQAQHIWEQRKRWSLTKSKFVDFLKCPKMAYWKHWHPGGGVLDDGAQDEMYFGTKVHKAYEAIGAFVDIEDKVLHLDEDQFDHYVDKLDVEREKEFREAIEHIIDWHNTIASNVQSMPDEEMHLPSWQDYVFPLSQEMRVQNDDDELYGIIDGVYEYPQGGVALVDIKHGKYDDHMQELMFYKHAYEGREAGEVENGNVCNAAVVFYTHKPVEVGSNPEVLTGDDLDQRFEQYLDTFQRVKNQVDDWDFTCPHDDCDYQEYHAKVEEAGGVMSREAIAAKRDSQ